MKESRMKTLAAITPILKDIHSHLRRDKDTIAYIEQDFLDNGDTCATFFWLADGQNTIYNDDHVWISYAAKMIGFALRGDDEFAHEFVEVHGPSYCYDAMGYDDNKLFQCFAQATDDLLTRYLPETSLDDLRKLAATAMPGYERPSVKLSGDDLELYRSIFVALINACVDILEHSETNKFVASVERVARIIS